MPPSPTMTTFAFSGNPAIDRDSDVMLQADYRSAQQFDCSLFATWNAARKRPALSAGFDWSIAVRLPRSFAATGADANLMPEPDGHILALTASTVADQTRKCL